MDTDRGFFGWLREPQPHATLKTSSATTAETWTEDTHIAIVLQINSWYTNRAKQTNKHLQ
jgi:hypothetical protein